jgi:hypothetical protein
MLHDSIPLVDQKRKKAMPKKEIDLPYRVDYLSILDENGQLDKDLEPDIPDDLLMKLHRAMLLAGDSMSGCSPCNARGA